MDISHGERERETKSEWENEAFDIVAGSGVTFNSIL